MSTDTVVVDGAEAEAGRPTGRGTTGCLGTAAQSDPGASDKNLFVSHEGMRFFP
ncbi:hypothetical protein [Streptomyces macrosporus]|uniref:Uncharacterized protein n=1 Tax=Streptomyces macrosporus TaxID=44032 RepID=A0ABN3JP79_9ACTN